MYFIIIPNVPKKRLILNEQSHSYESTLNSPVTRNFPFSYFAFIFIHCSQVIKDINNTNNFDKTTTLYLDFGRERFYRYHHMTP